jgi:hypothetical protein
VTLRIPNLMNATVCKRQWRMPLSSVVQRPPSPCYIQAFVEVVLIPGVLPNGKSQGGPNRGSNLSTTVGRTRSLGSNPLSAKFTDYDSNDLCTHVKSMGHFIRTRKGWHTERGRRSIERVH